MLQVWVEGTIAGFFWGGGEMEAWGVQKGDVVVVF